MIPMITPELLNGVGIPRESGDDPSAIQKNADITAYSPRERG